MCVFYIDIVKESTDKRDTTHTLCISGGSRTLKKTFTEDNQKQKRCECGYLLLYFCVPPLHNVIHLKTRKRDCHR